MLKLLPVASGRFFTQLFNNMTKKVLFLLPYPLNCAPSQRFRVEAYFDILKRKNVLFDSEVFYDEKAWSILYKNGSSLQKVASVIMGFLKRLFFVVFKAHRYEYIFVHREAAPLGPPLFEWWLSKVLCRKMIFDFDDAIWIPNVTESNSLVRFAKCFWKVRYLCKWSYKISAGNKYLADYAKNYNKNVVVVPTVVDTDLRYKRQKNQAPVRPVIGWTGSHSTLPYLNIVESMLQKLEQEFDFDFLVICDKKPKLNIKNLHFIEWSEQTEISDLLKIDIGLMPLKQDSWSEGKCGFKIIQYLSLGIPSVASPVGVNKAIVEHGKNGFLCTSDDQWYTSISTLLKDDALRTQFGSAGRHKIELEYSIKANSCKFLSLFS